MRFFRALLTATAITALGGPAIAQDASELTLRINRLEQQVRQLTGQNEEYAHQIRQLERQIQQLGETPVTSAGPQTQMPPQPGLQTGAAPPQSVPGAPPHAVAPHPTYQSGGAADPNIPAPGPQDLGTLPSGPSQPPVTGSPGPMNQEPGAPLVIAPDFQQNHAGSEPLPGIENGLDLPPGAGESGQQASIPATPTGSSEEEYALGAGFLQRKDYEFAQTQFQTFLRQFPEDERVPDALYGLGESFYQRKQYNDAIEPFLEVVTKHAQSPRAADSMLRLGQTLGAIDQKEQACATLNEIGVKYPRSNAKAQSVREMQRLGCS